MHEFYQNKYNSNPMIPLKAITYFDDINLHEPIKMTDDVALNWKKIEKRLINIQKEPNRIFQSVP